MNCKNFAKLFQCEKQPTVDYFENNRYFCPVFAKSMCYYIKIGM
jgi:hypothetical protein